MADFHGGRGREKGALSLCILFLRSMLIPKVHLVVENLVLQQQVAVLKQSGNRPRLSLRQACMTNLALPGIVEALGTVLGTSGDGFEEDAESHGEIGGGAAAEAGTGGEDPRYAVGGDGIFLAGRDRVYRFDRTDVSVPSSTQPKRANGAKSGQTDDLGGPKVPGAYPSRTWTDISGEHTIMATFLRVEGDHVVLEWDGQELEMPLDKLSEEDRRYALDTRARTHVEPGE